MIDESTLFVSLSWFDERMEMRLDVDNMSYEVNSETHNHSSLWSVTDVYLSLLLQELLALEDRIGNVTSGLSEESISGCLEETTYCLSNQTEDGQEEEKCVICLVSICS